MPILKIKNKETGQWEQVGVSTEATGAQIAAHNVASNAHADIRQSISQAATNASAALSAHNVAADSHADIRRAISELSAASVNLAAAQEDNMKFVISTTDLTDGVSALSNDTIYLVYE